MKSLALGCLLALSMTLSLAAELPGESIYRLEIPLQSSDGTTVPLSALVGKPLLITLFYRQCSSACPMITLRLQDIDRHLTPQARRNVTILMLSLDSDRDTPQALQAFRREHHIEDPRWIVARASPSDVRTVAAVLGVRYRKLPDGSFNHSTVIAVTDRNGLIKARTEGIGATDASFLRQVQAIAAGAETNLPGHGRAQRR
jgi:protein SCO1/2